MSLRIGFVIGVLSTMLGLGTATAGAGQLRLYNWADYTDPELITEFEAETGVDVVTSTYTEADVAEATLLAGGSGYDLAVISLSSLVRMHEADAVQALDWSRVENADGTDDRLRMLMRNSDASAEEYTLLYLWGHTGIAYDEAAVRARVPDAPLDSWRMIFDPQVAARLADCGIGIVDSADEVVSAALAYLGRDPLSKDAADIEAAFQAIGAIAPYVKTFGSTHYDALMAGEMCVAFTWNTEGIAPNIEGENPDYRFIAPREGTNLWYDVFVFPAGAANTEAAYSFMNFLYRPENMARLAEWGYSAGALPEARALMSAELADHPGIFPDLNATSFYNLPQRSGAEKAAFDTRWRRALLGM